MLEWIAISVVIFFIAILFYKQANDQIEILQLDAERFLEGENPLPTLYPDRSPIVVREYPLPSLGTTAELSKRSNLMNMQPIPGVTLKSLLHTKNQQLNTLSLTPTTASFLAKESGLNIWFQQTMLEKLYPNPYTKFLFSQKTYLWPFRRGLFQTTAFQTLLFPTESSIVVSLMLPKVDSYLPAGWKGKAFKTLTLNDTPLLNQINFIDIKLRKGNLLLLPPHLIVDVYPEDPKTIPWIFQAEIHHPISALASLKG